jgi:putative transposase
MGPNPTDRAKKGVKRRVLTDARNVPVAVQITAANIHDKWMVGKTLDAVAPRAGRGIRRPHHLCLDKGYDYWEPEAESRERGVTPDIRRRGEQPLMGCVRGEPQRWVVEGTKSWHNRYRALLMRWERKTANYLALLLRA